MPDEPAAVMAVLEPVIRASIPARLVSFHLHAVRKDQDAVRVDVPQTSAPVELDQGVGEISVRGRNFLLDQTASPLEGRKGVARENLQAWRSRQWIRRTHPGF